jgi:hypothetical protein
MNEELVRAMIYTEQIRNILIAITVILGVLWLTVLFKNK